MGGAVARRAPFATGALAVLIAPAAWSPLAFANGEAHGAVLTTWLVIPLLPLIGAWIASRKPTSPIGWLLLAVGLSQAAGMLLGQLGMFATDRGWPGGVVAWILWFEGWTFLGSVGLFPLLLLLFPDGRPPSPRWRPVLWLFAGAWGLMSLAAFAPGSIPGQQLTVDNPLGIEQLPFLRHAGAAGLAMLLVSAVLACSSLVVRWRRAEGETRLQMQWVTFAALVTLCLFLGALPTASGSLLEVLALVMLLGGIPAAVGVAVVRHRLYDLPLVINRTVVYALATSLLFAVYGGLTLVTVRLLEWDDGPSALVATAVVALLFSPARDRIQEMVDRTLFGDRSDPYQALQRLGRRLEGHLPTTDVVPELLATVRQSLRVPYVAVALGNDPTAAISHAEGTPGLATIAVALRSRGEVVGQLLVSPRPPATDLDARSRELLDALARQAGVAVHAARLQGDLVAAHARRIAAVEDERRRIRRDLHDGLGPTLAAIGLGLETAARRTQCLGGHDTAVLLSDLHKETQRAIRSVRGLVYGLRPPALDELGLEGALRSELPEIRRDMAVVIDTSDLSSADVLPAAVEVAAYRIATEAVANAARHGRARTCTVQLSYNGCLLVRVDDDGLGMPASWKAGVGITSMRERAMELGGTLQFGHSPHSGTRVEATLPVAMA